MGLLNKFAPLPGSGDAAVPAPSPTPVLVPDPEPVIEPVVKRSTDLKIKRDPHGFIESATGFNVAGEKVTFEFERNGKKSLERIKVKQ